MADPTIFQASELATPAAGTAVSTEELTTLNGGAVTAQKLQRVALALITGDGTADDVSELPVADAAALVKLTAILAAVDGLEGSTDGIETALGLLATASAQSTGNTALANILTELGQKLEPGDLSALATAAKQDAAKAVLDNLLTELGQKVEAADLSGLATDTVLQAVRDRIGEVQASPTSNTLLDRLKSIQGSVDGLEGFTDGVETALGLLATQTTLAAVLSELQGTIDVALASLPALPAGNNNIGDVDVASIAAGDNNIGNVDLASAIPAGTNNIGDVDVLTVPADPFGANADAAVAAGAAGSIQAKLRRLSSDIDAIKTSVETLDNTVGGSELQVDVVGSLPAGSAAIGKLAANSGVDIGDVDVTSISAGTNLIGDVGIKPRTSGGYSIATDIDLDETETEIKATAGQLFGWYIYNDGAAEVYVKLYNATAANVTVGSTTPVMTLGIPAGSAANVFSETGIAFGTAICAAATTVATTADATAPAANQVVANFFFA